MEDLHTPLSPLSRGESQKIEIPVYNIDVIKQSDKGKPRAIMGRKVKDLLHMGLSKKSINHTTGRG